VKANRIGSPSLLLYSITASNLHGTERVAIATLVGFARERPVALIAPSGPAVDFARASGITTYAYGSMLQKIIVLFRVTWRHKQIRYLTISVFYTYLYTLDRLIALHSPRHVHVVHCSGYPAHSYMSKKYIRWMPV
jgi:hypothetical protein